MYIYGMINFMERVVGAFLEESRPPGELTIPFGMEAARKDVEATVSIPVAAHQEDIRRVISTYKQQTLDTDKWHAFLFLNAPAEYADDPILRGNLDTLYKLEQENGNTAPLSWGLRLYDWSDEDGDFSMGKIRREAWWHMLAQARQARMETVGFSHDADTVLLSPGYLETCARMGRSTLADVITTRTQWGLHKDEVADRRIPAINRLCAYMAISEESFRHTTRIQAAWDGAVGFRVGAYVRSGGYQPQAVHTETASIIDTLKQQGSKKLFTLVPHEVLVASIRRYVSKASQGISPFSISRGDIAATENLRRNDLHRLLSAEVQTRNRFSEWCAEADANNLELIRRRFEPTDGENVELRLDFYRQLITVGRKLLNASGVIYDRPHHQTIEHTSTILNKLEIAAERILTG